jgi:hypothetical protein
MAAMCRRRAYWQARTAQPGIRGGRREAGNLAAALERRRVRKLLTTVAKDRCADPADLFFGTDRGLPDTKQPPTHAALNSGFEYAEPAAASICLLRDRWIYRLCISARYESEA